MRTGIYMDKKIAHTLVPSLKEWGISQVELFQCCHGLKSLQGSESKQPLWMMMSFRLVAEYDGSFDLPTCDFPLRFKLLLKERSPKTVSLPYC